MIREIINYIKHLKESSPQVLKQGLEPSKGLHILVELDDKGNAINFPGEKGINWDYYDGSEITPFLSNIILFEQQGQRVGTPMNKVFDKKKQIVSCSPYIISIKKEKLEYDKSSGKFDKIIELLPYYFVKGIETCIEEDDSLRKQNIIRFKNFIINYYDSVENIQLFSEMKKDNFLNLYFKNVPIEDYISAHNNYLKKNLFNKNDFNSDKELNDDTFGLSGFYNGLNSKKPFLEHKTASMYKGIAGRIQAKDTIYLNDFDLLLRRKIFPSPLPIFIDDNEFSNTDEIISIFKEDGKLTYSQILKRIFKNTPDKILQNYYLLFFNYKYELEDFDFVSKFRYSMKEKEEYPIVKNLFEIKKTKDEVKNDYSIKNIFQFEADIVKTIFNNSLVKIKNEEFKVNYFDEVKPEYVSGGEPVYQMILKYRKAFYDYIYKSKTQAINSIMWDEIMWNSIIGDLRNTNFDRKYLIGQSIKEKLNIWFSLYNYFNNNKKRDDMASKIPELLEKMKTVANNDNAHFMTIEEFAFGTGQVIYYLLNQSKASERTHALLEPFIQKVKIEQLQNSITQAINAYKHEISFGRGRFERLSAEVLGFDTDENLKKYQKFLLAGYFASPVIYEKKENKET